MLMDPTQGKKRSRCYNRSRLARNHAEFCSADEVILADGGFIGGHPLLCPVHSDTIDKETDYQKQQRMIDFNEEFTSNRLIVEDVFGWLKSRAKVLATKFSRKKETQAALMFAACRFYNFVRRNRQRYALQNVTD